MKLDGKKYVAATFETAADGRFKGYASKFNGVDSYGDTIKPGAYSAWLETGVMPKMFFNHDPYSVPIGVYTDVKQDDVGLYVEGKLTLSIQRARDVFEAMKAGSVDGLSIGYRLAEDGFEPNEHGGYDINKFENVREISIVTFPADGAARISEVKGESIDKINTIRDLEKFLRDSGGFSKCDSQHLVARVKALLSADLQREAEAQMAQKAAEDAISGILSKLS